MQASHLLPVIRSRLGIVTIDSDIGIRFDIFLAIASVVGHRPRTEIYVIAHNACSPRAFEELCKSALACLIDA
jgi:hypothetical protein